MPRRKKVVESFKAPEMQNLLEALVEVPKGNPVYDYITEMDMFFCCEFLIEEVLGKGWKKAYLAEKKKGGKDGGS